MKEVYKKFLKTKDVYVGSSNADPTEAAFLCAALAAKFGIKIVSGAQFVTRELFNEFYKEYTLQPVEPFYRGFPESVKKLDSNQLLMDQVINYFLSYTLGNFDNNIHSMFEESVDKVVLKGHITIRKFKVVDEADAMNYIVDVFNNLCVGSRPLNKLDYEVLKELVIDGASGHSLYNVDIAEQISSVVTGFPDLYPSWNMDLTTIDIKKVRGIIRRAVRAYYDEGGRYVIIESEGWFVMIIQQDPNDKDDYSVYVTNSYATVNSLTFEA